MKPIDTGLGQARQALGEPSLTRWFCACASYDDDPGMGDRDDDENEGRETVGSLRAAADAEAEAGDEARRDAARLRAENTRLEAKVARLSADVNRLTTKGVEVAAEYRAFVDGLTEALNAHGVPAMPSWRDAIDYLAAHGGTP